MANTKKAGCLSNLNASTISREPISNGLPLAGGGVLGRVKLYNPKMILEIAPNQKMFNESDQPTAPSPNPATIHPIVPHTRAFGNCSCGKCVKVIVFPNAYPKVTNHEPQVKNWRNIMRERRRQVLEACGAKVAELIEW